MKDFSNKQATRIELPDGGVLIALNLPPVNITRWVPRRKAEVVAAVEAGILTMPDACRRYRLSSEEFLEWDRRFKAGKLGSLKPKRRARRTGAMH
jgi:hypothetical protein